MVACPSLETRESRDSTQLLFSLAADARARVDRRPKIMRRFTLRQLAAATPKTLSGEFRSRLEAQLRTIEDAQTLVPKALEPARARIERGWAAAGAATSDVTALTEAEDGAAAAVEEVRKLPATVRAAAPAQGLLRSTFSAIVGHRALMQAAMLHAKEPLLRPAVELGSLLEEVVDDSRAFCREKFGDSPEARVLRVVARGAADSAGEAGDMTADDAVLLAPFASFVLHEILKNAMGAHVRAVGADKLDRLRPIEVRHGMHNGVAFVGVVDFGGGWGETPVQELSKFLHTTNPEREPTYTYSRAFGSPFEGLGCGLPLAALHSEYLGGELHLNAIGWTSNQRPAGAHASFTFDCTGHHSEPSPQYRNSIF